MGGRVSVVIPTYNRREVVVRAVQSVLAQTVAPDRIVVVDDGSEDGSAEALQTRFGAAVEVLRRPHGGVSAARNTGIHAVDTELIAFLDSDDSWFPRKLEYQLPAMDGPGVVLSGTAWRWAGEPTALAGRSNDPEVRSPALPYLLRGRAPWLSTWVVRRDALLTCGGFDEALRVAEDTAMLYALASRGSFAHVPIVLAERSAACDPYQLTVPDDPLYRREAARNTVRILEGIPACEFAGCNGSRSDWEKLLAYHLRRDLEYLAIDGEYERARSRALRILSLRAGVTPTLVALATLVAPRLVAARRKRSLERAARAPRSAPHMHQTIPAAVVW